MGPPEAKYGGLEEGNTLSQNKASELEQMKTRDQNKASEGMPAQSTHQPSS